MIPPHVGLTEEQVDEHILGLVIASYFPLKKGIELFGERAQKATTKELQATNNMSTHKLQDAPKLSKQEKPQATESLLFIEEKRMGKWKVENMLWVTSNAATKDMTNPQEVHGRSLQGD